MDPFKELKLVTGKHLPRFTAAEQELLKSGFRDFRDEESGV